MDRYIRVLHAGIELGLAYKLYIWGNFRGGIVCRNRNMSCQPAERFGKMQPNERTTFIRLEIA